MSAEEVNEHVEVCEACGMKIVKDPQPRWKSWAVWASALGALWIILSALGFPQKWGIEEGTFKAVIDAVGVILTGFGILNNPTDSGNF